MSIAELNTLYTAAVAAMDAADYDTAINKLMAIQVRLATTPNITRSLGGAGSQSITWNPAAIEGLISLALKRQATALAKSGGIRQTKVVYARATP